MINRKSRYEISLMKKAGGIVYTVLQELKHTVKEGMTTADLDAIAENIIVKSNAVPTFKGYNGFPAAICASVNEQVVHGIPSKDIILKEGDIISVDVGATYKGLVGDSAITIGVGNVSQEVTKLMEETKNALMDAIQKAIVGNSLTEVSGAIEDRANLSGYGLVKQYGGHGVGRNMHEEPFIFNYRTNTQEPILKAGMVIAIEPMFNLGTGEVSTLSDQWTVVTNDRQPSAHFEHTVAITENGPQILTFKNDN